MTPDDASVGQGTGPGKAASRTEVLGKVFAGLFGALLGLSLLKFGNPIILEKYVEAPSGLLEIILNAWPPAWGYWLLGGLAIVGLFVARRRAGLPRLLVVLPAMWLAWEMVSGTQTEDAGLTRVTLIHFASCVVCFYLGMFALSGNRQMGWFWAGLLAGFALVLADGFEQHFGGLEETRRYFQMYVDPATVPPELAARLASNRIFSTLFYANTLAGVVLMLLPVMLGVIASQPGVLTIGARRFVMGAAAVAGLACLYWSGSKGGWLLMLLLGFVAVLVQPYGRRVKVMVIGVALVFGLAGFFAKYSGFFKKGATSVVARFDYWQAGVQIARERPLFGTGPGTFAKAYARVKKPESEMARMTHNDYLEQACDSGAAGLVLYAAMVVGLLTWTFQNARVKRNPLRLAVWLAVLGWALQSFIEFHLYIPAMAWTAFALLGWLFGSGSNPSTAARRPATMPPA